MMETQTVLVIGRGLIIFSDPTFRLYSTYNRKFLKNFETVLMIERGLKIESIDFENQIEEADYIKS